jgi:hypothetical protein
VQGYHDGCFACSKGIKWMTRHNRHVNSLAGPQYSIEGLY